MNKHNKYHKLYDTKRWYRLRWNQLKNNPLCLFCLNEGISTAATIADHIKPHKGNESLFYDAKNLQSLCKACHDSTKKRIENNLSLGYDAHGNPINKNSHWYK